MNSLRLEMTDSPQPLTFHNFFRNRWKKFTKSFQVDIQQFQKALKPFTIFSQLNEASSLIIDPACEMKSSSIFLDFTYYKIVELSKFCFQSIIHSVFQHTQAFFVFILWRQSCILFSIISNRPQEPFFSQCGPQQSHSHTDSIADQD